MSTLYAVMHTAEGWAVVEDGLSILCHDEMNEAVETAHLLTVAARAAGGDAKMLVPAEGGEMRPWNLDRAALNFDRTLAAHGRSREASVG